MTELTSIGRMVMVRRETYVVYIPIATGIVLSVVLTVLLSVIFRR